MSFEVRYELRCSRDLALKLGAVAPLTLDHHRVLRDAGHLLVRDLASGWALFWPWQNLDSTARSS